MKKIISAVLIIMSVLLCFAACDGTNTTPTTTVTYKTDVKVADLMSAAGARISTFDAMSKIEEMYFEYQLKADPATLSEWDVRLQPGVTLDEVGIFKASSTENVDAVKAMVENYLKERNAAWTGLYMQDEYPKLENASLKVFGDYIVYCILSDAEKTAVFTAVEDALKAE